MIYSDAFLINLTWWVLLKGCLTLNLYLDTNWLLDQDRQSMTNKDVKSLSYKSHAEFILLFLKQWSFP